MEVVMGRVAEQNATDSEVKNFGARWLKIMARRMTN